MKAEALVGQPQWCQATRSILLRTRKLQFTTSI